MPDKRLRTKFCDIVGVEYPIMNAGMGNIAYPPLVAAVSNAGGLGVLGMSRKAPWFLEKCINETRALTDKPFGIDITIPSVVPQSYSSDEEIISQIPQSHKDFVDRLKAEWRVPDATLPPNDPKLHPPYTQELFRQQMEVILDLRVPVFVSGLGNPAWAVPDLHSKGIYVGALVGNSKNARRIAEGGADMVIAQGHESGGHTGRIGGLALLPTCMRVAREINPNIMVAYAGGITTGQQIAGVLAMGGAAVWCGTRFLATHECTECEGWWKEKIVNATEEDTYYSKYGDGMATRSLKPAKYIEAWETSGLPVLPMAQQRLLGRELLEGAREAKMWDIVGGAGGQGAGMIKEVKTVKEVIDEMVSEAIFYLEEVLPRTAEILASR